jgi:hypothetical protein
MTYNATLKSRFEKYRDDTVILKSTQYAHWTLPYLMADLQIASNGTQLVLERDYQEIGALLVNNLAAKLASLLFPTNRPFYRIATSNALKERAAAEGMNQTQLAASLARLEMDSCQLLFLNASYNQLVLAIKHLIVTGNTLLYRNPKTRRTVAYGVQSYATLRDGQGRVLDTVLREYTQFAALSPSLQALIRAKQPYKYNTEETLNNSCEVYTRIHRATRDAGDVFEITQEVDGVPVEGMDVYPELLCPFQPIVWSCIAGEHHGRGLVEDYAGGFAKLSDESQALALYGISAMKVLNLVAPGSGTDIDSLADAECGEYVQGTPDTIQALEVGEANKIGMMRAEIQDTFTNLARAFMWSGNTRDAERVTMYELQQLARETEITLGGTYSVLSEGMQIPLAHILLRELEPGTEAGLISGNMKLNIMAGLAALGRSSDVQRLVAASQEAAAIVTVLTQLDSRIDPAKLLDVIYAGQSVDTTMIFKDDDQIAEEEAGQAQAAEGMGQIDDAAALLGAADQLKSIQQ